MEIFMSAVRWLKHDWSHRDNHKYEILECVRFGNIAPWQLVDIKRNPENPDFMELAKDPRICKMIDDGLAYVIIKYWYGQENDDFQHWNAVLGLQEPPSRNWSGSDKTYFTYREFLIYLDQYRRNQLIEKNKPRMITQNDKGEIKDTRKNQIVSEKNSPRVPTMEEFLSKKKGNQIEVYHCTNTNEWKNFQNNLRQTKRKPRKWMSRFEAATTIQRAFRKYKKNQLTKMLNKEVIQKARPYIPKRQTKRENVLEMFRSSKNKIASVCINEISNTALNPIRRPLITDTSLFQNDRETVLVFGGVDPHNDYGIGRNTGKDIFRYITENNTWEFVGEMPEPRHHHAAQFFKGKIYLAGGSDPREDEISGESVVVDSMWSFDPVTRFWYVEQHLQEARKNFGFVSCNNGLYAIGGQGRQYDALKTMERFNPDQRCWEQRTAMKHSRTGLSCAKYRHYIWVVGGLSGNNNQRILLDSVESYNLKTDQWTEIGYPLRFPRCFSCMFAMSDRLYLIGGAGRSSSQEKSTTSIGDVDVWDWKKMSWNNLTHLHIPRHGHSVSYLGTQIVIIGGVTTIYRRALTNTECFCSQRETWLRGFACLPTALSGHTAITLPPAMLLYH